MSTPLLQVHDLRVEYASPRGLVRAVAGVSLSLDRNRILGLVGESGCGKSTVGQALLGLIQPPGRIAGGDIRFENRSLVGLPEREMRRLRGNRLSMIFQDPTATLNPVMTIGDQIAELFRWHRPRMRRKEVQTRVTELLERVGIVDADRRSRAYPHELSGGMRQRVVIACALALDPALIVADEPTTALDVTVQAQILDLIRGLQAEHGTAVILVSHDLGVIAETCDDVAVMYAGRIVESGPTAEVLARPRHPYTAGLIASRPSITAPDQVVRPIPGTVPDLANPPVGCPFHPRCVRAVAGCREGIPALSPTREEPRHAVACPLAA
ncbi:ABC transporter ATP-binding protein [Mesorhizobium sp. 1M-11]|uniref:ABC transporter ATP-binding protein n=1 Tax=Mesorhizobium sp. 1M-11 TaxID=1529006 RepID=UPI0006C75509|nr:ABC transporter ATP-binding protein [Mesorhizobium sp. 1M-11]